MYRMAGILKIDLKSDKPTVDVARKRLNDAINDARRRGIRVMKIIHGYGSTGVGGAIKSAVLASLRKRKKEGKVDAFVPGDRWDILDESIRPLIDAAPELARDHDITSNNAGISIVLLRGQD